MSRQPLNRHRFVSSGQQDGFTIIELMIATTVLSVILLLVTVMMISVGNLYYRGVNQARVQDAVRSITDEVSVHLQATDGSPTTAPGDTDQTTDGIVHALCIGSTRYTWISGVKIGAAIGSTTYQHILWRDTLASSATCSKAALDNTNPSGVTGSGGSELITPNSRLTAFLVTPRTSPYNITVGIAFGDDDLLNTNGINTTCKGGPGDQFCATSYLAVTVAQRL